MFRQIVSVAAYNFRQWHRNPRIFITFTLAFILCFLLSDKAVRFANEYGTIMQILEPFIWTFGDSQSILLSSLLLMLLFADMPFISTGTPFYLMRINRKIWLCGQAVYIVLATTIYMIFILLSTSLVSMNHSFIGNMWSETAAILGYSGAGEAVALPAFVKTLEMSTPYQVAPTIFLLMLLYTLLMVFIMLTFTIYKGQLSGVISVLIFNLFGFLLNPALLQTLFQLSEQYMYKANVALGWISPLNHATYHMHNFGYDLLPRLWQTYLIFVVLIGFCFICALRSIRKFNFNFTGTEG
ncbi:hypothetical protein [Bacillus niameyensis]|uniref:hypothetical protein n=1 Tax=Bacillus niameyensis TaxID=1522308 RepID=UPI000784F03C|nr:hypothetical protein [Bacillus niameyensis]